MQVPYTASGLMTRINSYFNNDYYHKTIYVNVLSLPDQFYMRMFIFTISSIKVS